MPEGELGLQRYFFERPWLEPSSEGGPASHCGVEMAVPVNFVLLCACLPRQWQQFVRSIVLDRLGAVQSFCFLQNHAGLFLCLLKPLLQLFVFLQQILDHK